MNNPRLLRASLLEGKEFNPLSVNGYYRNDGNFGPFYEKGVATHA